MGIVSLIACVFFLFFSVYGEKSKIISPSALFFSLWTFILVLSNLNLYDIYTPTFESYFLIFLMLLFFFIGTKISKVLKGKHNFNIKNTNLRLNEPRIKYSIIYFLSILLIIFTAIDCIIVIKNYSQGIPMSTIRRWRMGTYGVDINPILSRRSFMEEVFRNVILNPFELLLPPLAAYYFFSPEKSKHKYIILAFSIVSLALSSLAGGGGRLGFIYFFGCFFLSFIMNYVKFKNKFNFKKYKKYIIIFMVLGFFATFLYTQIRTSSSFVKQLYTYFALPPTLLSIWLPKIQNVPHTYGMLTLFGIHSYFFRAFQTLGMDFFVPDIYNTAYQYLLDAEIFYKTGYGVGNAFVTPVYYFYLDGGYFFVCFASFIFGILCNNFYVKFINNLNVKNFLYYCLLMYGVFLTFIRIQTVIPSYIISFVMVAFFFKRVEAEKMEETKE